MYDPIHLHSLSVLLNVKFEITPFVFSCHPAIKSDHFTLKEMYSVFSIDYIVHQT